MAKKIYCLYRNDKFVGYTESKYIKLLFLSQRRDTTFKFKTVNKNDSLYPQIKQRGYRLLIFTDIKTNEKIVSFLDEESEMLSDIDNMIDNVIEALINLKNMIFDMVLDREDTKDLLNMIVLLDSVCEELKYQESHLDYEEYFKIIDYLKEHIHKEVLDNEIQYEYRELQK